VAAVGSILSRRDLIGIGATYDINELKGYQVTADPAGVAEIAASPEVSICNFVS
jgi:oryzin